MIHRYIMYVHCTYLSKLNAALGAKATDGASAGTRVKLRVAAQAAAEGVAGTAGFAAAVVAADPVLAESVGAAGSVQALVAVPGALDVGVADEAVGAGAVLGVGQGAALSVDAASIGQDARVNA